MMDYTIDIIKKMDLKEVESAILDQNWSRPFLMQILLNRKSELLKNNS